MLPEFNLEWRGYNKQQVDEYIDYLRDEYERVVLEAERLYARVEELEDREESKEDIAAALIAAQSAAREIKREAREKADELISDAEILAHWMLKGAGGQPDEETSPDFDEPTEAAEDREEVVAEAEDREVGEKAAEVGDREEIEIEREAAAEVVEGETGEEGEAQW